MTTTFNYKDLLTWQNLDALAENDAAILAGSVSFTSDITISAANKGIVVKTPDGTRTYRIYVDDTGAASTIQIT